MGVSSRWWRRRGRAACVHGAGEAAVDLGDGWGDGGVAVVVACVGVDFAGVVGGEGAGDCAEGPGFLVWGLGILGLCWFWGIEACLLGWVLGRWYAELRAWVLGRSLFLLGHGLVGFALGGFGVDLHLLHGWGLRLIGEICAGCGLGLSNAHASSSAETEEYDQPRCHGSADTDAGCDPANCGAADAAAVVCVRVARAGAGAAEARRRKADRSRRGKAERGRRGQVHGRCRGEMGRFGSQRGPGEKGWSATRNGCDVIVEEEFDAYRGHGAGFTKVETGATGKGVGDTVGSC